MVTSQRFEARQGSAARLPILLLIWVLICLAALGGGNALLGPAGMSVELTETTLEVETFLGLFHDDRSIAREGLRSRAVRSDGMYRVAGTARHDACTGRWTHPELGRVWLASSCGAELVAVTGVEPPMLLGLARPDAFREALDSGATGTFEAATAAPASTSWRVFRVAMGLLLGLLLLLPALLLRTARGLHYRLESGRLHVPGLLGGSSVQVRGARLERRARMRWGKTIRVAGAAMPGLHLGLYRSEGRWVRMATTSLQDVVVVEAVDGTVVVTPAELPEFLEALRALGA